MKPLRKFQSDDRVVNLMQDAVDDSLHDISTSPQMTSSILEALGSMDDAFRLKRPSFMYASATSIMIRASTSAPAYFLISGKIFKVTTPLTCNIGTSLDAGTSLSATTVYYLYAVDASDALALIVSTNPPVSGPSSFQKWTYLGSFVTNGSSNLMQFVSSRGFYLMDRGDSANEVSTNSATDVPKTLTIPVTATSVYGRIDLTVIGAAGHIGGIGSVSGNSTSMCVASTAAITDFPRVEVPIIEPKTIYMSVSVNTSTASFRTLGWREEPRDYQ